MSRMKGKFAELYAACDFDKQKRTELMCMPLFDFLERQYAIKEANKNG